MSGLKRIGFQAIISTTVPIVIIGIIESSLWLASKATNRSMFASQIERYQRLRMAYPSVKNEKELVRVAIFGGSSSMGYAAPISFGEILEQNTQKLIIHNYAQPGAPFAGFQSVKLKALMPYYDIFIIYAGHNEIYSYNFKNSLASGQDYIYPNGKRVTAKEIAEFKLQNDFYTDKAVAVQENRIITGNLRFPGFARDLFIRANDVLRTFYRSPKNSPQVEKEYPLYSEPDDSRSTIITSNFKSEIESIRKRLMANQRLVLSTVLSNDLYPPVVAGLKSAGNGKSSWSLLNQKTMKAYHALSTGHKPAKGITYREIPQGAHYKYLKAVSDCNLDIISAKGVISRSCIDQLRAARASDNLPFRVLPQLNDYIRQLKGKYSNVIVIDPSKSIESRQDVQSYLSYFVDFQHPSEKGHSLISGMIGKEVFNLTRLDYSYGSKSCEYARNTNLRWLSNFIDISPVPHVHKYYHKLAANTECMTRSKTSINTAK